MKRRIALAGNPNSGKTSLFNELTGANQYVGNWPGVTVEHKVGILKDNPEVEIIDLPGIYSLSPYTPEEVVSRNYLLQSKPELILNIVDATNLERNLYLSTQLIETGLPIVMALNMMDLVAQRGDSINIAQLAAQMGCPVLEISALKQQGLCELVHVLTGALPALPPTPTYGPALEEAIAALQAQCHSDRFMAIKMLESEHDMLAASGIEGADHVFIEQQRLKLEEACGDDVSSIVAAARYDFISKLTANAVTKGTQAPAPFSSKLDRVLTHRVFGLGIFALVMWAIYWLSINTVGDWGTGWANDNFFGEVVGGWLHGFIGEGPAPLESLVMLSSVLAMCLVFPATVRRLHDIGRNGSWLYFAIAPFALEYICPHLPDMLHTAVLYVLYAVNAVILLACLLLPGQKAENRYGRAPHGMRLSLFGITSRAGRIEYLAHLILMSALAMGIAMLGLLNLECSEQVQSLFSDGIVGGVGAVLGFLPQMAVLFFLLSLLEDCGYMARVAFMMDRIFRAIGLSGKSFIPLLVSMGCGVPGVMATRTIENQKDRRMTIMLTCFMPCGAKLPIIALIGFFIGQGATIATVAYFAGIGSVILSGLILRKTSMFAGGYTPFVMEMPAYHIPALANINLRAMERCKSFVNKARTVIFLASTCIWFPRSYKCETEHHVRERSDKDGLADC